MEINSEQLIHLIDTLRKITTETEWLEFKQDYVNAEDIGEYISAIANTAALFDRTNGYLIWGIDNVTHEIVGTTFNYRNVKIGKTEEIEAWLAKLCNPRINFRFFEVNVEGKKVVVLRIPAAVNIPVKFSGKEWIRVGSNKYELVKFPDKEKDLWKAFDRAPAELKSAMDGLTESQVLQFLDYGKYCEKIGKGQEIEITDVFDDLFREKFVKRGELFTWNITNLGALLIGKNINDFSELSHNVVRVIVYGGVNRIDALQEEWFDEGYLFSYEKIVKYILTVIPRKEVYVNAIRKQELTFPEIAIRELVANLLIHQDIGQKGTYLTVEIFSDRIEFYNAGYPLININKIINMLPKSRNENLAGVMHRCGICEERGSGYDKIVMATSSNLMLAPKILNQDNQFTKVILYARIPFEMISKEEKIWTCYMQACLLHENEKGIMNSDVRKIFGLEDKESYKATRIINDTVEKGLLKPLDPNTAPRYMQYLPYWA